MYKISGILYLSSLCSPSLFNEIFETSNYKPLQSVQKFHQLLAEGIKLSNSSISLETLSTIPVVSGSHKKRIWHIRSEFHNNIKYRYIPFVNINFVKDIIIFIYSFFSILKYTNRRKIIQGNKIVICDALKLVLSFSAILASRLTKTKVIAIVTDLPNLMILNTLPQRDFRYKLYQKFVGKVMTWFDGYIVLAGNLGDHLNIRTKPVLTIEGLVDIRMTSFKNELENKSPERIILYAGGLYERYGVGKLLEAFLNVKGDDVRLHLYGAGELVKRIESYVALDERICYKGIVPNSIVLENLVKATLLVNPRPSDEEFTKYSFPSKNLEYMVSGTPLVTTLLPGMPEEYNPYVFIFEDESVAGLSASIARLLSKSREELHEFGLRSREFVMNFKNNVIQGQRLLDFIHQIS